MKKALVACAFLIVSLATGCAQTPENMKLVPASTDSPPSTNTQASVMLGAASLETHDFEAFTADVNGKFCNIQISAQVDIPKVYN